MVSGFPFVAPPDDVAIEHQAEEVAEVVASNGNGVGRECVVDPLECAIELQVISSFAKTKKFNGPKFSPERHGQVCSRARVLQEIDVILRERIPEKFFHGRESRKEGFHILPESAASNAFFQNS